MMTLRLAQLSDSSLLFEWRNHPSTREASHNTEPLSLPDHERWIDKTLSNCDRILLIAEEDGVPVGTVRGDWQSWGKYGIYELSWTVAPAARNRGVGTQMVALAVKHFRHQVRAEIKDWNTPSIRIAERAGLSLERQEAGTLHFIGANA